MKHFVYILQTSNGKLYTGYTTDLERRLEQHQQGKGAKFTRAFGASHIVHHEEFSSKSHALKREHEIKKLKRHEKLNLIKIDGDEPGN